MAEWHTNNDHDLPLRDGTIRTVSGRYVNLIDPEASSLDMYDIAHALSLVNRFGGHTAVPYSVAEHSLGVSNMLLRATGDHRLARMGLLHDAAEAYLGDVVRPLKRQMDFYREAEANLEDVLFTRFLGPQLAGDDRLWGMVKEADNDILAFEMSTIRNATWRVAPDPSVVREAFIEAFLSL